MNAIQTNDFTKSLSAMRDIYPNPKAILCISAHWMTEGSWVNRMERPKTIHDFYGFPPALSAIQYPAPGSPETADMVSRLITDPKIHVTDEMWGLDHGTWSVLRHIFPEARIPVLQLSVYISKPAEFHFEVGRKLAQLRDHGILIVGSGNIVHNLRTIRWESDAQPYDWAIEFDEWMKSRLRGRDFKSIVEDYTSTDAGKLSVPTPDHYYPLLYALGASDSGDELTYPFEGIQNGSISMRTICFKPENPSAAP